MVSLKTEGSENLEQRVGGACHPFDVGGERIIVGGSTKYELARQVLRAIRKIYSVMESIDNKRSNATIPKYARWLAAQKKKAESVQEMLFAYYLPKISPKLFVKCALPEEKILITLRDVLYGGKWNRIKYDLDNRKKEKPYIFKLINRVKSDLNRIELLRTYEKTHHINLKKYYRTDN